MRNPFRFFTELMRQPTWISIWVFYLVVINLASVWYWQELLAKVIFVTFMASAILMMVLYSRFGFERILGLGHILWVPLLAYILMGMSAAGGGFRTYLVILAVSITISLAFDVVDVWKYFVQRSNS